MKLIVVLSNQVELGKAMNAVGHMMIGVGPRIPRGRFPVVELYTAPSALVRQFRVEASRLHTALPAASAFSDFSHTTTDGSARDHAAHTRAIREGAINYFASCLCAPTESLQPLTQILNTQSYNRLKLAEFAAPNRELSDFDLLAPLTYPTEPDFVADDTAKKFSISLSNKLSVPDSIHELIRSCIILGNSAERHALRLHQYPDADGIIHPGMSEYGLVALKAKNPNKLSEIASKADQFAFNVQASAAASATVEREIDSIAKCFNSANQLTAIAFFGRRNLVNEATAKNSSLWTGSLSSNDFAPMVAEATRTFTAQFDSISRESSAPSTPAAAAATNEDVNATADHLATLKFS